MIHASARLITLLGLAASTLAHSRKTHEFVFHHENVMGTSLELLVQADGPESARLAETRVLQEIDRLARKFSTYHRHSELSKWLATTGEHVAISPELLELLKLAEKYRTLSGGAFDARAAVFTELWRACQRAGHIPSNGDLAIASARLNGAPYELDELHGTARRLNDCPLSFDAIAKGFIVERAAQRALAPELGVRGVLLNVGGDMRLCGTLRGPIGLVRPAHDLEGSPPLTAIAVSNASIATSGGSQRTFSINNHKYSHIIDPRSGQPVHAVASATVVAPSGAQADALATLFNVLDPAESLEMANSIPGVECLLVTNQGTLLRSTGFGAYELPGQEYATLPPTGDGSSWGDHHELLVHFEIDRPARLEGPYRRPYVVIWAENDQGHAVRTVSLWVSLGGSGPDQWLPDLTRWYRGDPVRSLSDKKNMVYTIARPTRPPGKYTVVWDGSDDKRAPLPAGNYTISVETAREHGTHQLIRKQVTLGEQSFTIDLGGNPELKSVVLEYRPKTPAP